VGEVGATDESLHSAGGSTEDTCRGPRPRRAGNRTRTRTRSRTRA